jgi:hypothetical protein
VLVAEKERVADVRVAADGYPGQQRVFLVREVCAEDGGEGAAQAEVFEDDDLAALDGPARHDVERAPQAAERAALAVERGRLGEQAAAALGRVGRVEGHAEPRPEPFERVFGRGARVGQKVRVRDAVFERREHALEVVEEAFEKVGARRGLVRRYHLVGVRAEEVFAV